MQTKVPMALQPWLYRLLAKSPSERFETAADALHALSELGTDALTLVVDAARSEAETQPLPSMEDGETWISPPRRRLRSRDLPPVPEDWDRLSPRRELALHGAGLGLWPLRARPVGGRKAQRDALWSGLRVVDSAGSARVTLLRGPAGSGKSTLARWLSERARELGAASAMVATHDHPAGRHDGLRGMLDRHLGCIGLRRGGVSRRMERLLLEHGVDQPSLADTLAELIRPAGPGDVGVRRFAQPSDRYDALLSLFRVLTAQRPLVLLLLDVQWALGLLPMLRDLLERQQDQPVPVHVVLTVDEADLQRDPTLRDEVNRLCERAEVESLSLGPLRGRDWAPFADTMGLDRELSGKLARVTDGNPLFAVQLVADWVQRGVLSMGEGGLFLKAGGAELTPRSLELLWTSRLDRLLDGLPADDARALELAAALGKDVDDAEWIEACLRAQCMPTPALTARLFAQRLARPGAEGWRFEHHGLRATLQERARAARRWQELNEVCAEVLRDGEQPLRLSAHLVEAGRAREAVAPLKRAIEAARRSADFALAHRLLEVRRSALEGVSRDFSAWGDQAVLEQLLADSESTGTAPLFNAPALLDRAVRAGWVSLVPRLERIWGEQLLLTEDVEEAEAMLRDAALRARMLGDSVLEAQCLATLAPGLEGEALRKVWTRSLGLFRRGGEHRGEAAALAGLCALALSDLRLEDAVALAAQLRQAGHRAGYPRLEATGWLYEGDVFRLRRCPADALESYQRAARLWPAGVLLPARSEGLALLDLGRYAEAQARFDVALESAAEDPPLQAMLVVFQLPGYAEAAAWTAFDENLRRGERLLWQTATVDLDVGLCARLAGDLALESGSRERARRAYELSLSQLKALGKEDEVATVTAVLQRLK